MVCNLFKMRALVPARSLFGVWLIVSLLTGVSSALQVDHGRRDDKKLDASVKEPAPDTAPRHSVVSLDDFPKNKNDLVRLCNGGRICDPNNLLNTGFLARQNKFLQSLAEYTSGTSNDYSRCPYDGYNVKVAVAYEIDDSFIGNHYSVEGAFADFTRTLGERWGVLNQKCHNGVMVLYSYLDNELYVEADDACTEETNCLFPRELVRHVVRKSQVGLVHRSHPEEVIASCLTQIDQIARGNQTLYLLQTARTMIFVYSLSCILGATVCFLSVCFLYDVVRRCLHARRLRLCNVMLERIKVLVNDQVDLSSTKAADSLSTCYYCVEECSKKDSVTLSCGHRYHSRCLTSSKGGHHCSLCRYTTRFEAKNNIGNSSNQNSNNANQSDPVYCSIATTDGGNRNSSPSGNSISTTDNSNSSPLNPNSTTDCSNSPVTIAFKTFLLTRLKNGYPELVFQHNVDDWSQLPPDLWEVDPTPYVTIWDEPDDDFSSDGDMW